MFDKESTATIDIFVDQLDLEMLSFVDSTSKTGRPSYPENTKHKSKLSTKHRNGKN